ncbi:MAG: NADH-quinone oxidoreductase subunit NuoH [Chloroflexota bacterium]
MALDAFTYELLRLIVGLLVTILVIIGSAVILSWGDRKVLGFTQDRWGPYHYGWQGLLTPIADTLKLLLKEEVVPTKSDKVLHILAPIVFVMACVGAFVVLPLANGWVTADLNVGLVYIVAVASFGCVGVLLAGWSSNNKYSTIGGLRAVGQMVSYEVPLVLSLVPPAMLAGSLQLNEIAKSQSGLFGFGWNVLLLPLAMMILFICGLAETNRNPFDLPEAENEIVAGYLTEYSGIRWAMFFMAEYGNMIVSSALISVLFLGGWQPAIVLPGAEWLTPFLGAGAMFVKTYAIIFGFLIVRATLPRLRVDQLMSFAWKVLIPLALVNIGLTGVLVVALPNAFQIPLGIINWAMAIGFVIYLPRLQRRSFDQQRQHVGTTVSVRSQGTGQLADAVRR